MRIHFAQIVIVSALVACLGILVGPARADYKNFGIYQDTSGDGILNPGDTFIKGFMNWYTWDSSATSYNYNEHSDPLLDGKKDLPGAPWATDHDAHAPADPRTWLPMHEDELHMYMVWSTYDNDPTIDPGNSGDHLGFSLGMIANNYVNSTVPPVPNPIPTGSGGYDLDIAIRNDGTTLPEVTLSDDYDDGDDPPTGRPPSPNVLDNTAQELYKITDPDGTDPYNHHFEGRWDYSATHSTADGGVIGGIHNGDYDIEINSSKIVTSKSGDGLVIRIDPQAFDEVFKIVLYDFGYFNGALDKTGDPPPAGYVGSTGTWGPLGIEIPFGTEDSKTFFISALPETVPEPVTLLSLTIIALPAALMARRRSSRI